MQHSNYECPIRVFFATNIVDLEFFFSRILCAFANNKIRVRFISLVRRGLSSVRGVHENIIHFLLVILFPCFKKIVDIFIEILRNYIPGISRDDPFRK